MPRIDIRHAHHCSQDHARAAVDRIADKLRERYQVDCVWDQDTLKFKRSGVDGQIRLLDGQVQVLADLGFLLSALRGTIESEIHRYLERELS